MKKDPKKNLIPFQQGQSGNPNGRPKTPEDIIKANRLTKEAFSRLVNKYLHMNRLNITENLKRPEASMLELLIGGMVVKAAKDHDWQRANFILDRIIGKAPAVIDVGVGVAQLSNAELIIKAKEAIEYLSNEENITLEGHVVADEV